MKDHRDGTVHGLAVLSNFDLLERAGVDTSPHLHALGVTREELAAGVIVEWDRFAEQIERALEKVRVPDFAVLCGEIVRTGREARTAMEGVRTQREAFVAFATRLMPALWWGIDVTLESDAPGFLTVRLTIPAPRRVPRDWLGSQGHAVASVPAHADLPPARIVDTHVDAGGRRLSVFLVLDDERARAPMGPLGPYVTGEVVVPSLDALDLAGASPRVWQERHGMTRAALLAGRRVHWDTFGELLDHAVATLGLEGIERAYARFAELTRGVSTVVGSDPEEVYGMLHAPLLAQWGPLGAADVVRVRPGVLAISVRLREGMRPCPALWRGQTALLPGLATHAGAAPAKVTALLDDDGCGAVWRVELEGAWSDPEVEGASVHPQLVAAPQEAEAVALRIAEAALRSRHAARAAVVERLGRTMRGTHDVSTIAAAVMDTLEACLELDAVELHVASGPEGALVRASARGRGTGTAIVRELEHDGRVVGALHCWVAPEHTGDALAAIDLLAPWVAVGLGTALAVSGERKARRAAEAERDGLAEALDSVLAAHPGAVFVVDDRGQVQPANDRARAVLAEDAKRWLDGIGRAVDGERDALDVLPVTIAGRTQRVVVIERRGERSFEERLGAAAAQWGLSARQRAVVAGVVRGMSNKEIASELGCAEVTVEAHLTAVYRKARVEGRQRLVATLMGAS